MAEVGVHHADDVRGGDREPAMTAVPSPSLPGRCTTRMRPVRASSSASAPVPSGRIVVHDDELEVESRRRRLGEQRVGELRQADRVRCKSAPPSSIPRDGHAATIILR